MAKKKTAKKKTAKKKTVARKKPVAKKPAMSVALDAAASVRIHAALRHRLEQHQSYNPPSALLETCRPLLGNPAALALHVAANAAGIADEHYVLLAAATHDCPELVHLAPAIPTKHRGALLQTAAIHGAARFIDAFVARGVDPRPPVIDGQNDMTALAWAVEQGEEAAVRALLAAGADATLADRRGQTPLARAIARNHGDCVAALLDHGVELSTSNTNQGGGLVLAVRSLAGLSVDLLLERGADPDALDARAGVTPLHVAVVLGHEPLVRQLVAAGGKGQVKSKKKLELRGVVIPGGTTAAKAAEGVDGLKGIF